MSSKFLFMPGQNAVVRALAFGFLNTTVTYMQFLEYICSPCKWNDKPVVLGQHFICDMIVIPDFPKRFKRRRYITYAKSVRLSISNSDGGLIRSTSELGVRKISFKKILVPYNEYEKIHVCKLQLQELYCSTFTLHVILKIT